MDVFVRVKGTVCIGCMLSLCLCVFSLSLSLCLCLSASLSVLFPVHLHPKVQKIGFRPEFALDPILILRGFATDA